MRRGLKRKRFIRPLGQLAVCSRIGEQENKGPQQIELFFYCQRPQMARISGPVINEKNIEIISVSQAG